MLKKARDSSHYKMCVCVLAGVTFHKCLNRVLKHAKWGHAGMWQPAPLNLCMQCSFTELDANPGDAQNSHHSCIIITIPNYVLGKTKKNERDQQVP